MDGDAELVARVRLGDRDSFDDLYGRYADDVFSLCLVILGDPAVAKAAAGTAFALVARTRLDLLSDPDRLRPWLLELARGSALAWSSSPRARNAPIPHGVSAEKMIEGGVVPAPASLRLGLTRTFDRASVAAAEERAAQRARSRDATASTAPTPTTAPMPAPTAAAGVDDADDLSPGDETTTVLPTLQPAAFGSTQPLATGADRTKPDVVPLPRRSGEPGAATRGQRTKPALAAATILVAAAVGVVFAVNRPSPGPSMETERLPDVAVVVPPGTNTAPPTRVAEVAPTPPTTVAPTVAGAFTSIPAEDDESTRTTRAGNRPRVTTIGVVPAPAPAPPPATQPAPPSTPDPGTNPPSTSDPSTPSSPSTSSGEPDPSTSSTTPPPAEAPPATTPPAEEVPSLSPPLPSVDAVVGA